MLYSRKGFLYSAFGLNSRAFSYALFFVLFVFLVVLFVLFSTPRFSVFQSDVTHNDFRVQTY